MRGERSRGDGGGNQTCRRKGERGEEDWGMSSSGDLPEYLLRLHTANKAQVLKAVSWLWRFWGLQGTRHRSPLKAQCSAPSKCHPVPTEACYPR